MGEPTTMEAAAEALHAQIEAEAEAPVETVEATAEEVVETETEQPEVTAETEVEAESETEGADDGAESWELGAEELSQIIGAKPEQINISEDGKLSFRAKVGDESTDVNLDQLINAYQGDANLTNRSKEVAQLEQQREAALAEMTSRAQQMAQQQNTLLATLEAEFISPYENINWEELRLDDPSEYAARRQDLADRKKRFGELRLSSDEALQQANAQAMQEMQAKQGPYITQQRDQLIQNIPTWGEKTSQDVTEYLKAQGLSDEIIGKTNDSISITLAYKAMLFDQGKKVVEKKLSKKLPKILRPGKRPSRAEVEGVEISKLRKDHKKTGTVESATALFKQKIKSG